MPNSDMKTDATPRFKLKLGKYGAFFQDTHMGDEDAHPMTLEEVLDALNWVAKLENIEASRERLFSLEEVEAAHDKIAELEALLDASNRELKRWESNYTIIS